MFNYAAPFQPIDIVGDAFRTPPNWYEINIRDKIEKIESDLLERFEIASRHYESENISNIRIIPIAENKIEWENILGFNTKENLLKDIEYLKNILYRGRK